MGDTSVYCSMIIALILIDVVAFKKIGQDCRDYICATGQVCVMSHAHCAEQHHHQKCIHTPTCMRRFDEELEYNTDQLPRPPHTNTNTNSSANLSPRSMHDDPVETLSAYDIGQSEVAAQQRQTNVLVIVQDGDQSPCHQYYGCRFPPAPPQYVPRVRLAPQLVPPTPPCYFNCFPQLTGQSRYPALPTSWTNNYPLFVRV